MKNQHGKTVLARLVLLVMSGILISSLAMAQGQNQYKFTNSESGPAKDIHIKFKGTPVTFVPPNPNPNGDVTTQTPSGTFPIGNGTGTQEIDLANGFTGAPIPAGGSIILTFGYGANKPPEVEEWWWTNDNDLDSDGRLGNIKKPKGGTFSFASIPSEGDGSIVVSIDNLDLTFQMPAGLSGEDMANAFSAFIETGFEFLLVDQIVNTPAGTELRVFPTALGSDAFDFTVMIQPDSVQGVSFAYDQVNSIPTLSEWGLIILGFLLLSVGSVYMMRRRKLAMVSGR